MMWAVRNSLRRSKDGRSARHPSAILVRSIACCLFLLLASAPPLHAADIEIVSVDERITEVQTLYPEIRLRLTGEIQPGDASKLQELFEKGFPEYYISAGSQPYLSLDSEGGSFGEGVALMRVINELAIRTVVEDGASCLSACALAFMGGRGITEASTATVSRTVYPGGRLGFHAPSLGVPEAGMVPAEQLQQSFALALQALGALMEEADDFDFALSLIQTIVETPPDDMYILETVDDFVRWGISVPIDNTNWMPDGKDIARLCMYYGYWADGQSAIEGFASEWGEDWRDRRREELAAQVQFQNGRSFGIPAVYAHVQTIEFEYNEFCVVEALVFGSPGNQIVNMGVHLTNGSPQDRINDLMEANITTNVAGRLHALPPSFRIEDLPRVPYP